MYKFENLACLYNISLGMYSSELSVIPTSLTVCHELPLVLVVFLVSIAHEDLIFSNFSVSDKILFNLMICDS